MSIAMTLHALGGALAVVGVVIALSPAVDKYKDLVEVAKRKGTAPDLPESYKRGRRIAGGIVALFGIAVAVSGFFL